MPNGPLSPPARLCLLAWDPARPGATDSARVHHLVRAGALTELARRGLLVDDDGVAVPADPDARTGDAVLDGLLDLVRESMPHRWRTWVRRYARVTFDAVREQLVAEGQLRAEKKRVLGLFPSVEYVLERPAAARALRERTRAVLEGAVPADEISERDAAVAVLAAVAEPRALGTAGTGADWEARIAELTGRAAAAPGRRRILIEVRGALRAEATDAVAPSGG
ncbi:GPP34 family phosphoprotein [Streptomyces sp. WAC04189]|uniref:GOLPH3/VPS74 family protein n=1 Tax=Streptomyces TaxID=1883 RepID=UPI000FA827DE|nr:MULTISPECIES: GPP34 family phosphoprotein [unclassified Streptomyces]QCB25793.1 GPP34 family phosphoprotein [Streptomyces sp. SS52]RSS02676.1 GPP34 family phosphoprotein [Streptomyces sp. WAC04189]UAX56991.1 GPP34 family phosphoprotein [Streptomyces sp. A144]